MNTQAFDLRLKPMRHPFLCAQHDAKGKIRASIRRDDGRNGAKCGGFSVLAKAQEIKAIYAQ